jgi:hypothetical protein
LSLPLRSLATGFYWIGVASVLACVAFALAGNTEFGWRFEHTGFPMSYALGLAAILAFLAFEVCDSTVSSPSAVEERSSELSPEWETVEL